ncbi:MAG: DOPA 4,5-dioxygenase family protein [Alphaproteobacteria bacterium]|jgi:aromatic ring-cleaving dioxygenase|nr:DOPA 4,5-dioxygenase family protein [Alphaproteobacteria bacterium]
MTENTSAITGYHAHVYYGATTKAEAEVLRAGIAAHFETVLGRWHDKPVGPHPHWSYQIAFETEIFSRLVPWLALNRQGLNILLHPETGDAIADHSTHAMWLGESVELNLDSLR